jgi:superfamily II DNA or RNA helicase
MLKIIVENSISQVLGMTNEIYSDLKKLLSYKVSEQARFYSGKAAAFSRRYLIDKKGYFPTGLLYIVLAYFKGGAQIEDRRTQPDAPSGRFKLTLAHTPYPEQKDAAEACQATHRGIVVAPTGVGKSLIIALLIDKLQLNTLIVVPTLELKRQLTESLQKAFGVDEVGEFGKPIAVENVDSLETKGDASFYHCVIIDEFHHSAAATYRKLNKTAWKNIYYRFGLTATPFRSQDNERLLLESVLSHVIYRVEYQEAVKNGYIVPMEAYYIDVPRKDEVTGYTWSQVYSELVVNNEERNSLITQLLLKLSVAGHATLCLVKEIKHGNNLANDGAFFFCCGMDNDSKSGIGDFNKGKIKTLIGTTGVLGEGVDTKPAEWVIIAGLGKSKNAFMQQCGRAFRTFPGKESCKVILFRDTSHKWTRAHFKAQVKYLKEEYGIIPAPILIT